MNEWGRWWQSWARLYLQGQKSDGIWTIRMMTCCHQTSLKIVLVWVMLVKEAMPGVSRSWYTVAPFEVILILFHLLIYQQYCLFSSSRSWKRLFVNSTTGHLTCWTAPLWHCSYLHHVFGTDDGQRPLFLPHPHDLNTQQQARGPIIVFTLRAVFRNEEERNRIKVRGWRLWTFKLLDGRRKAVRCVIIGTAYAGLKGIFRQLENTFSGTGWREEVNSRRWCVNKSNLGERRVGMFHYVFLEAVLCRFKWVIESDI